MEFIFKNVLLHFGGRRGGATEIVNINLLRTWFVYIERAVNPKYATRPPFTLAYARREDVNPINGRFSKI